MQPKRHAFIVDQMLGRLTKWLRLMGYDALYFNSISDRKLLKIAKEENRILLTRDTRLMERREVKNRRIEAFLIGHDSLALQLEQLGRDLHLSPQGSLPYCTLCNVLVEPVEKEKVKEHVPPYVFETQTNFARCPSCGRLYWRGTHWQHIQEDLIRIFKSGAS